MPNEFKATQIVSIIPTSRKGFSYDLIRLSEDACDDDPHAFHIVLPENGEGRFHFHFQPLNLPDQTPIEPWIVIFPPDASVQFPSGHRATRLKEGQYITNQDRTVYAVWGENTKCLDFTYTYLPDPFQTSIPQRAPSHPSSSAPRE